MISTTVYVSKLNADLKPDELDNLLTSSRANNARNGISGLLTVRGRDVMQVLEGDAESIRHLYARISQDPRHSHIVTVWTSTHSDRRYPDWAMGFDDLGVEPQTRSRNQWPAPHLDAAPDREARPGDESNYVDRRTRILRRALFSGNRLTTTLGIILDGHRPETSLTFDGFTAVHCSECRILSDAPNNSYPCSTAKNAIWALEAALPPSRH